MQIKLEAIDTLFFGDGKPFTMGEETWSNGIFPPPPSVFLGALRSAWFSEHPETLEEATSEHGDDPTSSLSIQKMCFEIEGEAFLPAPYDLLEQKEEESTSGNIILLQPVAAPANSNCLTDWMLEPKGQKAGKVATLGGRALISLEALEAYWLQGTIPSQQDIRLIEDCWGTEPKVGIAIDRKATGSTLEGRLYRLGMKRATDVRDPASFLVEIHHDHAEMDIFASFEEEGIINIGAEGKGMRHQPFIGRMGIDIPEITGNHFKLSLATPAIFTHGWMPGCIDPETMEGVLTPGLKVKLLAVATGKPLYLGGFDMALRQPKSMKRAVPAGAVYYFEILEGAPFLLGEIHQQNISDEKAREGFGLAYIGTIDSPQL